MTTDDEPTKSTDSKQANAQAPDQSSNGNVKKKAGNRERSTSRGKSRSKPRIRGNPKTRGKSKLRRSRAKKRKLPCMRSGKVTNNPFLNFLRVFRKKNCGLRPQEAVKKAAQEWKTMSPDCKQKFIKSARSCSRRQYRKKYPNGPEC